jgi:hypothetical protein
MLRRRRERREVVGNKEESERKGRRSEEYSRLTLYKRKNSAILANPIKNHRKRFMISYTFHHPSLRHS